MEDPLANFRRPAVEETDPVESGSFELVTLLSTRIPMMVASEGKGRSITLIQMAASEGKE